MCHLNQLNHMHKSRDGWSCFLRNQIFQNGQPHSWDFCFILVINILNYIACYPSYYVLRWI